MTNRVVGWCALWVAQGVLVGCFDVDDLVRAEPSTDASVLTEQKGDAGLSADAAPDAAPQTCDVAHPCGANDLCTPDGLCTPRCDANGICIAASSASGFGALVADGAMLYFTSAPSHDAYGNPHDDAAMWSLSAAGELHKLRAVSEPPQTWDKTLLVDTTHLYWKSATHVWRIRKDGSADAQALYPTTQNNSAFALVQNDQIALLRSFQPSMNSSDFSCTIEVGSRDGSAPPRLANAGHEALGCMSASFVDGQAYIVGGNELQSIDLASGQVTGTGLSADPIAVVPPYVYSFALAPTPEFLQVSRWDLRNPGLPRTVVYRAPADEQPWQPNAVSVIGDRLYQLSVVPSDAGKPARIYLVSSSLVDLGSRDKLLPTNFAVASAFFVDIQMLAVTDSHAFFVANRGNATKDGGLLYAAPLSTH